MADCNGCVCDAEPEGVGDGLCGEPMSFTESAERLIDCERAAMLPGGRRSMPVDSESPDVWEAVSKSCSRCGLGDDSASEKDEEE
jgi:hypothetical protein